MNNKPITTANDLAAMLKDLSDEVESDAKAAMSETDRRLDEITREVLRLERDMTVPGSTSTESVRIERLMNFIEEREF